MDRSWGMWWIMWLKHHPSYLRNHGSPLKLYWLWRENTTLIFTKYKRKTKGTPGLSVSLPCLTTSCSRLSWKHGVTKGKLCLTNLVSFYNGITALVDQGKAVEDIYLNLYKKFVTLLQDIFASKLKTWVWQMDQSVSIKNLLDGCTQRAVVNSLATSGVCQRLV